MAVTIYLLSLLVIIISAIYLSFKKSYRLWSTLNVPFEEPEFPFGNFKETIKKRHFALITRDKYEQLKTKGDYAGLYVFQTPTLFVTGPEFAKTVLVRDFNTFVDRGVYFNKKDDPLSANLFFMEGKEWKELRHKLTPAFTSNKMKTMFHTITDVADELIKYIDQNYADDTSIDLKDLMARFTTDVITSCVFGIEGNSIQNPNSDIRSVGKKLMKFSKLHQFLQFLSMSYRDIARSMGYKIFNTEITEFFTQLVHKNIGYRRENNIHRNDLMQIMIEHLKVVEEDQGDGLTIDEVAANSFIFFFAGFETSSVLLSVALYYLAKYPEIQKNAQEEIKKILQKYDNQFTYEAVNEFDLLERILYESLRLFSPVGTLHRVANNPYTLPNGSVVPAGTFLIVPVQAMHYDKDIYPEPEKFDPDRFTNENKAKRHPYSYLPFGEGPRFCIGQRFALLQTKIGLSKILNNFNILTCPETPETLEMDNSSVTVVPKEVWVKFEKI